MVAWCDHEARWGECFSLVKKLTRPRRAELTKRRRQLTKEQLNEQIIALRKEGMSYRAIADETGASKSAVGNTINEAKNEVSRFGHLPERIIGKDGKKYPR